MVKNKLCFVIMPFSSTKRHTTEGWTEIYEDVHTRAITGSRLGYKCERSKIGTGSFIKDILLQLNQADVVLADLTDMNPNVFYELGVRHALRNRTILVSQTMDDVPSDLKQYGVITYGTSPKSVAEYKKKMSKVLRNIRDDPDRADNPVSDYLHQKSILIDSFEAKMIEKKLVALVSECSFNLVVIKRSLETAKPENMSVVAVRFSTIALELLTSTYYIYPNNKYIKTANQLLYVFTSQNSRLNLQSDPNFQDSVNENIRNNFPNLEDSIKKFMQETHKILKDFRNQNFVESTELTICVEDDSHKKILDDLHF